MKLIERRKYLNTLIDVNVSFDDYVIKGGMADSYLYKNQKDAYKYIEINLKTDYL